MLLALIHHLILVKSAEATDETVRRPLGNSAVNRRVNEGENESAEDANAYKASEGRTRQQSVWTHACQRCYAGMDG